MNVMVLDQGWNQGGGRRGLGNQEPSSWEEEGPSPAPPSPMTKHGLAAEPHLLNDPRAVTNQVASSCPVNYPCMKILVLSDLDALSSSLLRVLSLFY